MRKENKTHSEVKNPIYGNWMVYSPFDSLMFYCDDKRANWYLKRNAAILIKERTIKLTFMPKGMGSATDLYGASPKENECVVCGSRDDLNRHHIVPRCFRKYFPEEYKSRNAHDIVPLCSEHHSIYETMATGFKKEIALEYEIEDWDKEGLPEDAIKRRKIKGYLERFQEERIPKDKRDFMEQQIKDFFGISVIENIGELKSYVKKPKSYSELKKIPNKFQIIVSKIENIQQFVERWRSHFIEYMQPKFLPIGWNITRDAKQLETKYD